MGNAMSLSAHIPVVRVDLFISEGFVLTELSAIIETLRLANRVAAREVFSWRYVSTIGGAISCRSDATVVSVPAGQGELANYLFVLGNSDPDHAGLSVQKLIRKYMWGGAKVVLLSEAASRFIAEGGQQGHEHTTHWENRAVLNERGTPGTGSYALAVDDGRVITSAGMAASYDLMLSLLGQYISAATVSMVADILLHENIRTLNTLQPFGGKELTVSGNRGLDQCIELMQANLEEPLRIAEIVSLLGISERSLERHFQTYFNTTPNTYYRELRLNHANTLLLKTKIPVREVGLTCGFPNGFSSLFRRHFGVTPTAWRRADRKNLIPKSIKTAKSDG